MLKPRPATISASSFLTSVMVNVLPLPRRQQSTCRSSGKIRRRVGFIHDVKEQMDELVKRYLPEGLYDAARMSCG
jgi:hypothetical protein